ncbi:hypothetical protein AKJ56_01445 [candidate division MSBL1 archaeon SCGC-AAA382N08]|uniref:Nucleotidyl transferase domain-containing protein n=1 Tax=candidate division MSBL1 archaeon SCGC-AAA382N08 TaxID=1698285 RepID=A0A133VPP9_9EURY|nr:hypothetical protein AKJ56_01445 [candidate division MSBL1 archaeon SCGC-AAA382N08]
MKALILAGGYATRLWPITKKEAKPLLPLAGTKILDYILDEIEQNSKIDTIYVTTNERFEESFEKHLSNRKSDKYELVIESQEKEEEKYGAIGGMMNVIENKEPDDYLIIGGDNYYSFNINDFIDFSLKKKGICNAVYKVESIEEAKNYGIVDFDENYKIRDFQEKPENPKSRMASTACYFFPKTMLKAFDEYVNFWDGKISKDKYLDEPGRFLEWISERYDTYAFVFEGKWVDIGTREGYLRAEREVSEGNTIRCNLSRSEIGENVTILENSKIENSEIENSIIFEGCKIKGSVIIDTIVGKDTEIVDKEIREGLIKKID